MYLIRLRGERKEGFTTVNSYKEVIGAIFAMVDQFDNMKDGDIIKEIQIKEIE